jgi:chromosome segregation ATPase
MLKINSGGNMSSDEKKDRNLDADILQGKADILNALRAAGKLVPETDMDNAVGDTGEDIEIFDLPDEPENIEQDLNEVIALTEEEETSESVSGRTASFEEEAPAPAAASESPKISEKKDTRRLEGRISALLEENERLNADLKDHIQDANQIQRLRFELSQTEVVLSRERSNARMLETKLNEVESFRSLLEQDCRSLSEKVEDLEDKEKQLNEKFKGLQTEHAEYREKTGREVVDLNKQIEIMREDSEALKNDLVQSRRELEEVRSKTTDERKGFAPADDFSIKPGHPRSQRKRTSPSGITIAV